MSHHSRYTDVDHTISDVVWPVWLARRLYGLFTFLKILQLLITVKSDIISCNALLPSTCSSHLDKLFGVYLSLSFYYHPRNFEPRFIFGHLVQL